MASFFRISAVLTYEVFEHPLISCFTFHDVHGPIYCGSFHDSRNVWIILVYYHEYELIVHDLFISILEGL